MWNLVERENFTIRGHFSKVFFGIGVLITREEPHNIVTFMFLWWQVEVVWTRPKADLDEIIDVFSKGGTFLGRVILNELPPNPEPETLSNITYEKILRRIKKMMITIKRNKIR